jgi:enoyl-CoA hydratase/carnithine racemase
MPEEVELSVSGEVATVLLRRPAKGNALSGAMFDQLRKIGLRLTDTPPRFVVVTGEGPDFCVGLERDSSDSLYQSLDTVVKTRDGFRMQELLVRLRASFDLLGRVPCPVIAAIEGRCLGAGLELALTADVRVIAEDATLAFDDARYGLVTGLGGVVRAVGALGSARTLDRLLTGRPFPAREAESLGLAARVVPPGSALAGAKAMIDEMRRASPVARTQGLLAVRGVSARLASELLEQETQTAARTWIAPDWQAALQANKDKREPSW